MNKKIKLSGGTPLPTSSPWPPSGLKQSASSASNNPATPGQVMPMLPGVIYAPYIPLYTSAGCQWKLTAYLLSSKELILPLSVYEKSIELLNNNINSNGTIPKIVNWKLDKIKYLLTLIFYSFERHVVFEEFEQIQTCKGISVKIPKNFAIPYGLNVTLANLLDSKKSQEIADAFEKSYHDVVNSSLSIYLKGTMTVTTKEIIKDISNPHDSRGKPWKVFSKEKFIKEIVPKTMVVMEGTRNLQI